MESTILSGQQYRIQVLFHCGERVQHILGEAREPECDLQKWCWNHCSPDPPLGWGCPTSSVFGLPFKDNKIQLK